MMNALINKFPTSVSDGNHEYEIDSDYRTAIRILTAFDDPDLLESEKQAIMLANLYKGEMPPDPQKAWELAAWFLSCGDDGAGGVDAGCGTLFDFQQDAKYIYSAIRQSHGVDLQEVEYLHWWKFNYLLFDLRSDCFLQKLIELRAKQKTGKLSKEERQYCARIAPILELKQRYSSEELDAIERFDALLSGQNPTHTA